MEKCGKLFETPLEKCSISFKTRLEKCGILLESAKRVFDGDFVVDRMTLDIKYYPEKQGTVWGKPLHQIELK